MRQRWRDLFVLSVSLGVILFGFRKFVFPLGALPLRGDVDSPFLAGDLTSQFAIWIQVAIEAVWRDGVWPLWNPYTHAGTPLLALPQAGAFGLATLLGGFFSSAAAIKLSALFHLWLGAGGVYWVIRSNGGNTVSSGLGAIFLGLSPFLLGHTWVGHFNMLNPIAWMPWTLGLLILSVNPDGKSGVRRTVFFAFAAGVTAAIQIWEGGDSVPIYEVLAGVVIALVWPSHRALLAGAVAAIAAIGFSAPQLLTMASYLPLTSRGAGLTWEQSYDRTAEVGISSPGHFVIAVAVLGALFLLSQRSTRRAGVAWLAIASFSALVAGPHSWLFHILWRYFPTFHYQRLPERGLCLLTVAVPVLAGFGAQALWVWSRQPWRWVAMVILALPLVQTWKEMPAPIPLRPVADELAANSAVRWLRKAVRSGERVHFWEVSSRDWGVDHVTQPLGLEIISGNTASEHGDYFPFFVLPANHRTYFTESYRAPAKFWGLLGVKYVVSETERGEPGFKLAARVQACPSTVCQPRASTGTWIYENLRFLPRVRRVAHTIAIQEEPRRAFEKSLDLMLQADFDPSSTAVLQGGETVTGPAEPVLEGAYERESTNGFRVNLPAAGWWVISERVGLFPGWKAFDPESGREYPIYRADGVLGAVHVPAATRLRFSYSAPGFIPGCWVFAIALLISLAWFVGLRSRVLA